MKVCIVSPSRPERMETFIRAHVERLPFETIYLHGPRAKLSRDGLPLRDAYEQRNRSATKHVIRSLPSPLKSRLDTRFAADVSNAEIAIEFLKSNKIDAVLAEYGTTASDLTDVCRLAGVPLFAHFHGFDASRTRILHEYAEGYRSMFAYASGVFVVSRPMHAKVIELGCPEAKVILNPYGPDPEYFGVEPDYDSNSILAVGRLTEKKAPDLTLRAFAEVLESRPELQLRIVGDGDLRVMCDELVASLGVGDNVIFEGALPPATIRSYMKDSFLFVQHSIVASDGDMEGTPVAILEAGAAGLPVVSTRHAGIPEIVSEGETGLLVAERDVSGMARAILRIADDRVLARTLGAAAKRRIENSYTMDKHIETIAAAMGG